MTKEAFVLWAKSCGWSEDAYGHLHKGDYRFKIQANSVRYEKSYRTPDGPYQKGEKRYVRIRSGFFSKLSVTPEGKLVGLTQ